MGRMAFVFEREEIEKLFPTMLAEVIHLFTEKYGEDIPIAELNGKYNEAFWKLMQEYFNERFLDAVSGDVEGSKVSEKLKEVVDDLVEERLILPSMVEGAILIARNGLFVVEMIN